MRALLLGALCFAGTANAQDADVAGGQVPTGVRIAPYGAATGVQTAQSFVVGSNGGTNQTLMQARYASGRFGAQFGLPVVSHRLPRQQRDTGLGNLQLDAWYALSDGDRYTALGLEAHVNLGERTYTWVNNADDIWPSNGVDLVLQTRSTRNRLTTMMRTAIGARFADDFAPFESRFITFELAMALDYSLSERVGLRTEMSVSWWDTSPWDLSLLGRVDLVPGLRLRAGLVVPLGVWAGMAPIAPQFDGANESTLVVDLGIAL
ncbi:MAG: hypothetical protein ACI9MC_004045 [Kiritimatiellia bacterium]|jgi:hypothetical protein